MERIQTLSPQVANLIAAGEVVERPASIVKELLENSIDAGATRVTVEVESGGVKLLRVIDNGCGMSPRDAVACFGRHATSKVREAADLASVCTLGFRGEALASVAAVSKVTLRTLLVQRLKWLISFSTRLRARNFSKRIVPRPPSSAAFWKNSPSRVPLLPSLIKRTGATACAHPARAICQRR